MLSVHLCDVFGGILAGFGHRSASDGELRPQRWIQFTRELHTNLKNVSKCSIFKINREKDECTRLGKGKLAIREVFNSLKNILKSVSAWQE